MSATGSIVEDHARALLLIAEKGRVGESYNVGGNNEKTNLEVVRTICALDGRACTGRAHRRAREADHLRRRIGPGTTCAMPSTRRKMRRELGWAPQETFESGLAQDDRSGSSRTAAGGYASAPASTAASASGWWRDPAVRGWRAARTGARRDWPRRGGSAARSQPGRRPTSLIVRPSRTPSRQRNHRLGCERGRLHDGRQRRERARRGRAGERKRPRDPGRSVRPSAASRSSTSRPTTSSTARRPGSYVETDPSRAARRLRLHQGCGRGSDPRLASRAPRDPATSWVYGALRAQPSEDRAAARGRAGRAARSSPTSAAARPRPPTSPRRSCTSRRGSSPHEPVWGTYHFAGTGATTWLEFVRHIVAAQAHIHRSAPARRPDHDSASIRRQRDGPQIRSSIASLFAATFGFRARPWQTVWRARSRALVRNPAGLAA